MATVALPSNGSSTQGAFGTGPTVSMDWSRLSRPPVAMTAMRVKRRLSLWLQVESSRDAWISIGALGLAGFVTLALLAVPLF